MRDKLARIVVGIATVGTLSMLPACGESPSADETGDRETTSKTTDNKRESGSTASEDATATPDDGATPSPDGSDGTVAPDGQETGDEMDEIPEEGYSTDVEVVEAANTDHTPAPEAYNDAEIAAAEAEAAAAQPVPQVATAPAIDLHSDSTKVVMQDPSDGSYLVFYCSGDAITALHSYAAYPDATTAQIAASNVAVGPENQVQGVHIEGNFVVTEQTPDAYADLTASTIESAYPDMVRV